jgi:hypothetical protein
MRASRFWRNSISSRIAGRVNPVIETAIDPKYRFQTRFETMKYGEILKFLSIPAGICFVLNLVPFINNNDTSSIYGWRFLAHFGPYHVPKIVEGGKWREALTLLEEANDLGMTESEIAQLLTDIEIITQRRVAVRRIVSKEGFPIFLPILKNLASPSPINTTRKGQSHFEANLRVAMDVVSATPAKDRRVPIALVEAIVENNRDCWESDNSEDTRRFREYRLLLILKLLQNIENVEQAKQSEKLKSFILEEAKVARHQPYPTLPVMPLLYQFKTKNLGFETVDLVRKILKLLDISIQEDLPKRESLSLPWKLDFVNFEKLVYLTICYSSLRVVPMISEYSMKVLGRAAYLIARSVAGSAFLEATYRAQEHIIQSAPWYDGGGGVFGSAVMSTSNALVGALILKHFPFCGLPWFMMKFRDSFVDSYRFV